MQNNVALASQSPRRLQILKRFGFNPVIVQTTFQENLLSGALDAENYAVLAARRKAEGALSDLPIVAADTIVVLGRTIFGKPPNADSARQFLSHLSGRWHTVISAVVLKEGERQVQTVDHSRVLFKDLSATQIDRYVASGEPEGKAGAYAIQGLGSELIAEFQGSFWNIVGFPIESFFKLWQSF
ncbi:MAG TPA: nucleoside triphosphate pyrophosphatase [Acidobacteriota bacterium]|jgi:septum formation protein